MAGILFILRRMHSGIIRHADHHAALRADVAGGKHQIRHHVQTDMLAAGHGARADDGRAERRFRRHLFIGRPFHIYIRIGDHAFRNFRAGRSGIGGNEPNARLIRAPRNGGIADQQLFHGGFLSFLYRILFILPYVVPCAIPSPEGSCTSNIWFRCSAAGSDDHTPACGIPPDGCAFSHRAPLD